MAPRARGSVRLRPWQTPRPTLDPRTAAKDAAPGRSAPRRAPSTPRPVRGAAFQAALAPRRRWTPGLSPRRSRVRASFRQQAGRSRIRNTFFASGRTLVTPPRDRARPTPNCCTRSGSTRISAGTWGFPSPRPRAAVWRRRPGSTSFSCPAWSSARTAADRLLGRLLRPAPRSTQAAPAPRVAAVHSRCRSAHSSPGRCRGDRVTDYSKLRLEPTEGRRWRSISGASRDRPAPAAASAANRGTLARGAVTVVTDIRQDLLDDVAAGFGRRLGGRRQYLCDVRDAARTRAVVDDVARPATRIATS